VLFLLKLFCCLSVLRALKHPGPGEGGREGTNNIKMRAFRIMLVIMLSMMVNYLPFEVTLPLKGYLNDGEFCRKHLLHHQCDQWVGAALPLPSQGWETVLYQRSVRDKRIDNRLYVVQ
jgi:hypothetical protein